MSRTLLLIALLLLLPMISCNAQPQYLVDVSALEVELGNTAVQLVDVRTPWEWKAGHIAGAVHIDWYGEDFLSAASVLDKNKPVRLYCAAGGRSEEARAALLKAGFTDVKDLQGGMGAWEAAGKDVVK